MKKDDIKKRVQKAIRTMPSRENVRKIYLFGSQVRGEMTEKSDVDLLVELTGAVGYFELVRMERHLEENIGMPVDLVTDGGLSKFIRPNVLRERELVYEV